MSYNSWKPVTKKKWGLSGPCLCFFHGVFSVVNLLVARSWRQSWRRLFLGSTWRLDRRWPQPTRRWPRSNHGIFLQANACRCSLHNGVDQRDANAKALSLKQMGHRHLDHGTLPRLNHDLVPRSNSGNIENVDLLVDGEHRSVVTGHVCRLLTYFPGIYWWMRASLSPTLGSIFRKCKSSTFRKTSILTAKVRLFAKVQHVKLRFSAKIR